MGFVTGAISRQLDDMSVYTYYMAGPPPMIEAALNLLDQNQVPLTQIYYDSFG